MLYLLADTSLHADNAAFYTCPDRLRLPLVFYVAHTSAVFVNKMMLAGLISVGRACLVFLGSR